MVDKTLGIDESQANVAMEASKSEGTLLSVVAGKDVHEKFAAQQEKTFKSFEKISSSVFKSPGAAQDGGTPKKKVPQADDFFSNLGVDLTSKASKSASSTAAAGDKGGGQAAQKAAGGDKPFKLFDDDDEGVETPSRRAG
eukprot:CAMPEP_0177695902 /NCGR_PEP_ID=MMETSP0484_2-20121128/3703_1 /TAXON_ID=354590 /ORGANISM="Rhodomonas lens, Strain RHODO" /LENGTH=139 /DNA_ID=CAMNT_0019206855 /DNA_START=164 /DNA_END=580 /DNA_ORIENTATION=+